MILKGPTRNPRISKHTENSHLKIYRNAKFGEEFLKFPEIYKNSKIPENENFHQKISENLKFSKKKVQKSQKLQ